MARLGLVLAGLLALASLGSIARADEDLYTPDGPVKLLNESTWDKVLRFQGVAAVRFLPTCPPCARARARPRAQLSVTR
jgi:hypothetical protein